MSNNELRSATWKRVQAKRNLFHGELRTMSRDQQLAMLADLVWTMPAWAAGLTVAEVVGLMPRQSEKVAALIREQIGGKYEQRLRALRPAVRALVSQLLYRDSEASNVAWDDDIWEFAA